MIRLLATMFNFLTALLMRQLTTNDDSRLYYPTGDIRGVKRRPVIKNPMRGVGLTSYLTNLSDHPGVSLISYLPNWNTSSLLRGSKTLYHIGTKIGSGSFADVRRCIQLSSLDTVALKLFREGSFGAMRRRKESYTREVAALKQVGHHPNVARLIDVVDSGVCKTFGLLIEYAPGQTLDTMQQKAPNGRLSESTVAVFAKQVLQAIRHIHCKRVVHRDIKPENIIVTKNGSLKLLDFGESDVLRDGDGDEVHRTCGTPMFHPPEIARGEMSFKGFAVDVWCLGVTTYFLLMGKYPYTSGNIVQLYSKITQGHREHVHGVSVDCCSFVDRALELDGNRRATVDELLSHPWVSGPTLSTDGV